MNDYGALVSESLVDLDARPARFIGTTCSDCSLTAFPPRRRCAGCAGTNLVAARLAPYGRLYSYSVSRVGRPGERTPFVIGVADFPGGVRVLAKIDGWDPDSPESPIGRTVLAGIAAEPTGESFADYRLVLVEQGVPT